MQNDSEETPRKSALAKGWHVVDAESSGQPTQQQNRSRESSLSVETKPAEVTAERSRTEVSNLSLVLYGVFGGLYLLYTVGWFLIAQYFSSVNELAASTSGSLGGVLQQILFWAACLAPMGWFTTVLLLSRERKTWFLPGGLLLGLLVLLPLPLFIVGSSA
jgi:hypothetical protein